MLPNFCAAHLLKRQVADAAIIAIGNTKWSILVLVLPPCSQRAYLQQPIPSEMSIRLVCIHMTKLKVY